MWELRGCQHSPCLLEMALFMNNQKAIRIIETVGDKTEGRRRDDRLMQINGGCILYQPCQLVLMGDEALNDLRIEIAA